MEVINQYTKLGQYLPCDNCGKERYFKRFEILKYKNHFCSSVCLREWLKRTKVKKSCIVCGTTFFYPKSQKNRTTCSERCKGVRSTQIQQKRKGLNKLEIAGRDILLELGISFHEQFLIENKFLVDVFVPKSNLVIQWDGRYWHNKPKRKSLDKSQDAYMKKCGYSILRFSDYDVYKKPDYIKEKIHETLSS